MYFSPQPGDHTIGSGGQKFGRRCYFQNHAHNEESEGRLRVTLVSRNACFAHKGRLRVTLVSRNACFAHEGRLRVSLVSRNARFAHEGRPRVSLVSQSGYFAHEGLGT